MFVIFTGGGKEEKILAFWGRGIFKGKRGGVFALLELSSTIVFFLFSNNEPLTKTLQKRTRIRD